MPASLASSLLSGFALEITGKDIGQLAEARQTIPAGTQINIAFLGNETHRQRIDAAAEIRRNGFEPVPIISSRRLKSREDLHELMSGLRQAAAPGRFIFVGGDPDTPAGPYRDSLELIGDGIVERYGIARAGIVAYPEGHPKIDGGRLTDALHGKIEMLSRQGCAVEITTQFGLDADAVGRWIGQIRAEGIDAPIRIGIPGPAAMARLLRFAVQFGARTSNTIVVDYLAGAESEGSVTADAFMRRLAAGLVGRQHGALMAHLYPFCGIARSCLWARDHTSHALQTA